MNSTSRAEGGLASADALVELPGTSVLDKMLGRVDSLLESEVLSIGNNPREPRLGPRCCKGGSDG